MFWLNPATHGLFGPISAQRSKHLGSSTASAAHGAASWCSLGGVPKNEGNGFIHKLWPFWWGVSTIYGHPNGIYPQFMVIWKKFDQWTSWICLLVRSETVGHVYSRFMAILFWKMIMKQFLVELICSKPTHSRCSCWFLFQHNHSSWTAYHHMPMCLTWHCFPCLKQPLTNRWSCALPRWY